MSKRQRERDQEAQTTVADLRAAWEEYARVAPSLEEYEEEELSASLYQRFDAAMRRDVLVVDALRALVLRTEESPDYRGFADFVRGILTPWAQLALSGEGGFRSHIEVGFDRDVMPIRPALALPVLELLLSGRSAKRQLEGRWSWFAGTPVGFPGDRWPRRADGRPLVHVVQVALDDGHGLETAGLPGGGVLQVFHDLVSHGVEGDDSAGAWHVRWLKDPGNDRLRENARLLRWPREIRRRDRVAAVPINADVVPTMRSPLDAGPLSEAELERYERVYDCLEWWTHLRNQGASDAHRFPWSVAPTHPWAPGHRAAEPASKLGGFGHAGTNPDYVRILESELPLEPGDSHYLLADINPYHFSDQDWFHGSRHLEVWIRRSDLDRADFEHVWCFIRTDA